MSEPLSRYMRVRRELDAALVRVEELERELEEAWKIRNQSLRTAANLREALEFYADAGMYRWSEGPPAKRGVIQAHDKGARARQALADEGTEER